MTLREQVLKAAAFDGQAFEKACLDNGHGAEFSYHQKIIRSSENQRLRPLIEALAETAQGAQGIMPELKLTGRDAPDLRTALAKLEALLKDAK